MFSSTNPDVERIYKKYLLDIIDKIRERYHDMGLVASGEFGRKLEYLIEGNKLSITGVKHTYWMEKGRRRGTFVPVQAIYNWILIKPTLPAAMKAQPMKFAWAISNKIKKEGIEVPNFFNAGKVASQIVEEFLENDLEKMLQEVGITHLGRIESDLMEIFRIAS